jgi:hypothetical protein
VSLHERLGQGQADARVAGTRDRTVVGLVYALEQALLVVRRYAASCVGDGQQHELF